MTDIGTVPALHERWQGAMRAFQAAVNAERHQEASGLSDAMEAAGRALIDTPAESPAEVAMKLEVVVAVLDEGTSRDGWERRLLRTAADQLGLF